MSLASCQFSIICWPLDLVPGDPLLVVAKSVKLEILKETLFSLRATHINLWED